MLEANEGIFKKKKQKKTSTLPSHLILIKPKILNRTWAFFSFDMNKGLAYLDTCLKYLHYNYNQIERIYFFHYVKLKEKYIKLKTKFVLTDIHFL